MNPLLLIPTDILNRTLDELKEVSSSKKEAFVLWLGDRTNNRIKEMYVPEYVSGKNYYQITDNGNSELFSYLKKKKLAVLAQIHTHPREAFHSLADDKLATVAHVGGLSFVLPDFAKDATLTNFAELVKSFQLSQSGEWLLTSEEMWRLE